MGEPTLTGTASGTTSTCIQTESIGGKTFYRYEKTFYHCKDLYILRDIIWLFMQRDGLIRSFDNLKDYCPQPSTTPSYEAFGQSHFCFYSMRQEDAGTPSPLARGNAALHHKTRFEHTLDGACRRLFDPAKHHVDSVLRKHGHVLFDRGQSRLE